MKSDNLGKHLAIAFLIAAVLYFATFSWIEHGRVKNRPWEVTFLLQDGKPSLVVNQPDHHIENVRIIFPDEQFETNREEKISFPSYREVPFDVPFGKCVFLDTLFLPGTVVFEMFGHRIQLMPRILTLDDTEHPWAPGDIIPLHRVAKPADAETPAH